jgi:hypothetical protein
MKPDPAPRKCTGDRKSEVDSIAAYTTLADTRRKSAARRRDPPPPDIHHPTRAQSGKGLPHYGATTTGRITARPRRPHADPSALMPTLSEVGNTLPTRAPEWRPVQTQNAAQDQPERPRPQRIAARRPCRQRRNGRPRTSCRAPPPSRPAQSPARPMRQGIAALRRDNRRYARGATPSAGSAPEPPPGVCSSICRSFGDTP